MKKTIIFDLKNTLIDNEGDWIGNAKEALELALADTETKTIIYSMNEPWTYRVITEYLSIFCRVDNLLLVGKKSIEDIKSYGCMSRVLVYGDSLTEEIGFAKILQFDFIVAQGKDDEYRLIKRFLGNDNE